jgi:hypothetical protein
MEYIMNSEIEDFQFYVSILEVLEEVKVYMKVEKVN